jgi:uncharacterized protein (TIGR00255 family)
VINAAESVQGMLQNHQALDPLELLRWPGVLQDTKLDMELVKASAKDLFGKALDDMLEGRGREGVELATLINQRLDAISAIVVEVRENMPKILQNQRDNLAQRLAELQADLDDGRLEQEIALLAQKADVDEEMDRLDTHVQEVRRVLKQKGPIGRRLDFLMQELNREANTLSSKSLGASTTQCAVELKVLIEQMREQIQNIE